MLADLLAMAQDPHAQDTFLLLLASHLIVALAVGLLSWMRGLTRGRELQAMEIPQRGGAMHFADGRIIETRAPSASGAINKLLAGTPQAHRPSFSRQWD